MNPILVDTNAYTAFKRGDPDAVAVLQAASVIAVGAVVLGELRGGFAAGVKRERNDRELDAFLALPQVAVLPVDAGTADHYAAVYAALRTAGTPIPTNDLWIAATALQYGLRLFTLDGHFAQVAGLRVGTTVAELSAP